MFLVHCTTGHEIETVIELIQVKDYKEITSSKRFPNFKWKKEKKNEVFKLHTNDSAEILGLLSLTDVVKEKWIKINLIESSIENVGEEKQYDKIAGCLIAYACRLSFIKGYGGCVALKPKTSLAKHYVDKYTFKIAGMHLYVELKDAEKLINDYLRNPK